MVRTPLNPRPRTLDGFIEAVSQAHGIDLTEVDAFSTLVVRTDNSVYHITVLRPSAHEVLVQGMHLEFHARNQWIITSHVRAIAVEPSATGAPC